MYSRFEPVPRLLMGPGPSSVPNRVLEALSRPTLGHLDPQFIQLMDEVKALLQNAFKTTNELTIPISAPGSAGMETCFMNLLERGDEVLIAVNGVFGARMVEVAERIGAVVHRVDSPWGTTVDVAEVKSVLEAHPATSVVAFVHAETSTGVRSDAQTLCQLAREHGCLSLVDAVTSLGGIELRVDEWGIDAIYSGSQKCLSCVPGLSPVSFSDRAVERIRQRKTRPNSRFLDLTLVMDYWGGSKKRAYHHTAPVNAIYALHESLGMLAEEGLEQAWTRHQRGHERLAAGLADLSLDFIVKEEWRLPQLNAVHAPGGLDEAAIRQELLERHALEIGAGLGQFAGHAWRIGLMGHSCRDESIDTCLNALEDVISRHSG